MNKIWRVVWFLIACLLLVGIVITGVAMLTGASLVRIHDAAEHRIPQENLPPEAQELLYAMEPGTHWLDSDEQVLAFLMDNYQVDGADITAGELKESGSDENGDYKRFRLTTKTNGHCTVRVNVIYRRHIDAIGPECRVLEMVVEQKDAVIQIVTPTTGIYVPADCLYLSPLSSYVPLGGDNGFRYLIDAGENSFSIENRATGQVERFAANTWKFKSFTPEEWSTWFLEGYEIPSLDAIHTPMRLELSPEYSLLCMKESFWLMEMKKDQVWSIYSLMSEEAMGQATWSYVPDTQGIMPPMFRFAFGIPGTAVSAVCTEGGGLHAIDPGTGDRTAEPRGELSITADQILCWSPISDNAKGAPNAVIRFTVHDGEETPYSGVLYITGEATDQGTDYTIKLVGTGLHIAQDESGALIALAGVKQVT